MLVQALPPGVRGIAVLDRCKDPGADGPAVFHPDGAIRELYQTLIFFDDPGPGHSAAEFDFEFAEVELTDTELEGVSGGLTLAMTGVPIKARAIIMAILVCRMMQILISNYSH